MVDFSRKPEFCPLCGSKKINEDIAEWFAESIESEDLGNETYLREHSCQDCLRSFWT